MVTVAVEDFEGVAAGVALNGHADDAARLLLRLVFGLLQNVLGQLRRVPQAAVLDLLQKRRPRLRLAQFRQARQLFAPLLGQIRGFLAQPLDLRPFCLPAPPFGRAGFFSSRTRFSNWRLTRASRSLSRCSVAERNLSASSLAASRASRTMASASRRALSSRSFSPGPPPPRGSVPAGARARRKRRPEK